MIAWPGAAQELDLNLDGVVDFAVEPGSEYWDYANYVNWWDLVPRGTNAISTNTTFAARDVVGPEPASAWLGTVPPRLFSEGNQKIGPGMSWPTFGGLLWELRDLFLGLRLAAADGVHYGWVQFHLIEQMPFTYQVTLVATAFQPHAGQPILVGQQPPAQPTGPAGPLILEHPSGLSVRAGDDFSLAVVATANPFPTYEWWRGGHPIPGSIWNVLQIHDAQPGDTGDYQVSVSNAQGTVLSQAAHVFVGYALEVRVDHGGTVRVDPARELYEPGQQVQLEAVPDAGWRFRGWEGDASGMANPFTLTINRHHRVKAVFTSGPGDLKWAFKAGGAVSPCPAIGADGTLYFGVADWIVALDAETAQARWEFRTGGAVLASPAVGHEGWLYAGSGDGRVYALNGVTGQKEWEYLTDGRVYTPLSIGPEGTVYACSDNGMLHALSGATGQQLWQDNVLGHDSPAIGPDGTAYVVRRGAEQSQVYGVNGTTGQRLWDYTIDSPEVSAPALDADGTVYVSSGFGVYALDGATGQKRWNNALVSPAPPAIAEDGTVYVVSGGGFGLSRDTGQIRWRGSYDLGDWMPRAEAALAIGSDGTVYATFGALGNCRPPEPPSQEPICESFTAVQALDGVTGQKVWSWKELGGDPTAPAIGPDGTVYVASGITLYAFRSASVRGLAASPWPKFRADAQNTGRVRPVTRLRLAISRHEDGARFEWTAPAVLQSSDALVPADWQDLSEAASPYDVEPANAQRFYRLRRPRRRRCALPVGAPGAALAAGRRTSAPREPDLVQAVGKRARSKPRGAWWLLLALSLRLATSPVAAAQPGEKLWEFATSGRVRSCPAIGTDGTVYVGSEDGKVYALQGATGQERWSFQTGSNVVASPALGWDDTVYVGSKDGSFYALNGATGERKWVFATDGPVELSAAISAGGTIYVSSSDQSLYALDAATGAKQWRFSRGGNLSSPAIGLEDVVYVVSDGILTALNGLTGQKIWDIPTGWTAGLSPSLGSNGTVYVSRTEVYFTPPPPPGGEQLCVVRVLAFDGATGRGLWSYAREHDWGGTPPVLGPDGRLFLGTSGDCAQFGQSGCVATLGAGELVCWFRASSVAHVAYSCPAIGADGTVYVASRDWESNARMYALNGADATVRWEFAMEGAGVSSPVIGADGVVCAGVDNRVVALQGNSGPAPGVWSMERADARNTGRVVVPRRPPHIIEQPADALVAVGASLWLEVVATGVPAPTYQWSRDGQLLAGATQSVFAVGSAQPTDAGEYQVMLSNAEGGVTSRATRVVVGYRLTVSSRPAGTVEVQPSLEIFPPGQSVQLRAVPETGRRFLRWEGDGSGDGNPLTLAMDRHRQVEAVFSTRAGDLKWKVEVHGRAFSCPALGADGTLYLGLGSAPAETVQALDEETGQSLWQFPLAALINPPGMGLEGDGTVYVGAYDHKLYALEGATGRKLWEYPTDSGALSYPALGPDGKVWVTSESTLYALDGATGHKVWELHVGRGATDPSIGRDGTVYVGASGGNSGRFSAVNPATGQKRWDFATGPGVTSAAIDWEDKVYFGAGGLLYALEGSSGQERWRFAAGNQVAPPALGADGTVFLVAGSRVYGLNGATGQRRWEREMRGGGFTPAVGLDGTVYVVSTRVEWLPPPHPPAPVATFFLDALDGLSGVPRWTWEGAGEATSAPAIGLDGTVYFGTVWWLYAFESASSGGLAASPWPKFRADAQNAGRVRPPAPLRLTISWHDDQVRIEWTTPGVLQATDALVPGDWRDVHEATSPYAVEPAHAQRYFRLRRPRRRSQSGGTPRALRTRARRSGVVRGVVKRGLSIPLLLGGLVVVPAVSHAAQPGETLWEFQTGATVYSSPATAQDGTVYVGSLDRKVYALNGVTGQKLWEYATGSNVVASPAVAADGTVYVGSLDRKVYALRGDSGEKRWDFETAGGVESSAAVGHDGTVFVGSRDGKAYALRGQTGEMLWEFIASKPVTASPALGANGALYVTSGSWGNEGHLYALDAASGRKRWMSEWGHEGSPAIGGDDTVYVVGNVVHQDWVHYRVHCTVRAFDGTTGRQLWRWESPVDTGTTYGTPSIGADGTLYVLGANGQLFALKGATGTGRSVSGATGITETSATLDGAGGAVIHGFGKVYSVHVETGELLWECPVPWGQVFPRSCPTIGRDGIVYVGSEDGRVYAILGRAALADSPWPKLRGDAANTGRVNVEPLPPALPQILEQPTGVRIGAGGSFTLSVTGIGQPFPTFQWCLGEEPIAGATEPTFKVTSAHLTDTGDYRVLVSNPVGSVTSVVARVVVGYHLYVSARPSGDVQLQPSLSVYEPGQVVELTAIPRAGQTLLRWEGDAQGRDNPLTLMMDGHKQIVAVFTAGLGDLKWQFVTGGAVHSSPALGTEGTLYIGSDDQSVYALNGATGARVWEFRTGAPVRCSPSIGEDGMVYVGSDRFYALEGQTGAKVWEFKGGSTVSTSPALSTNGTVYFGVTGPWPNSRSTAKLYALDGATGRLHWERDYGTADKPEWLVERVTIGLDGAVYAIAEMTGGEGFYLSALEGATGADRVNPAWWWQTKGWSSCTPAFGTNQTMVATKYPGNVCFAADARTWELRWETMTDSTLVASPTIGADGSVYLATDSQVVALEFATGARRWAFTTAFEGDVGERTTAPALAADGTVYVGSVAKRLYALAASDGAWRWEYVAGGPIRSCPVIGPDGTVFFGCDDGKVYALLGNSPLAKAPWPMISRNPRHTGSAEPEEPALPRIVSEPAGLSVPVGGAFSLTVVATGNPPLTYQWHLGGQPIVGATRATYGLSQARTTDGGNYQVVVSNPVGSVTSVVARVVVVLGYYVNVSIPRPGGTVQVEPSQSIYEPGQVVTLTALPQPCHVFVRWDGAAQGVANPLTLTVEGHTYVDAWFGTTGGTHSKWQFRTGGPVHSSPALGTSGSMYVGSSDRKLYALDGATGQKLWEYETGGGVDSSPAVGDDGTVYVGSHDAWVYAVDGATGLLRWKFLTGSNVVSSPAIGMDGVVFVGSNDRRLYALNGATGQKVWEFLTGGAVESSPAVGLDGTVYVGSADQRFYAVDGRRGEKLWEFGIGGNVGSPALDARGRVYVGSTTTGKLYALDGVSGQKVWEVSGFQLSPVLGPDGTLYGGWLAVDSATGLTRWYLPVMEWIADVAVRDTVFRSSPAVAGDGTVWATKQVTECMLVPWPPGLECPLPPQPLLSVLCGATGETLWVESLEQEGLSASCPLIGPGGMVYVGAQGGWVHAVQGNSGLAESPWPRFRGDARNTGRVSLPAPLSLRVLRQGEKVRIEWSPAALLQSTPELAPAGWQDVSEATSPYDVEPANAQRFYRLRRPRSPRRRRRTRRRSLRAPHTPSTRLLPSAGRGCDFPASDEPRRGTVGLAMPVRPDFPRALPSACSSSP
jgi:outer membrane protein assembly factor BamB